MRIPLSWLAEHVDLAPGATGREVAAAFVSVGLEEEDLHGGDVSGPIVVGRVLSFDEQVQKNGKPIRYCIVDVGAHGQQLSDGTPQEIVCGAHNFAVGDLVVVVLPGAVLPGGFAIAARKTYGRVSHGMICAEDELGIGTNHAGIIVLDTYLGAEAAAITPGDDAIALLGIGEEVVEVNVTPDRGYCFSVRGLAREYWHALGSPEGGFRDPAAIATPAPTPSGYAVELADEAPLEGRTGCDRFVTRVVRGVDPTRPSPTWMQQRLTQMGMRPISLAVDITNYVMLAVGQALHAYDLAKLSGPIVVRRARPGEHLSTLDAVDRTLDPQDLLITDGGKVPLALAGVMGGATSEIDASTTDVLVEAAHFEPTTIARSSRRHRLISEASKRFERGVDPGLAPVAAQLVVDLLVEHGGGTADPGVSDVDRASPRTAYLLEVDLPSRLVGRNYPRARVVEILRDLGCTVEDGPGGPEGAHVRVTPPSWRPDLIDGPDYVEEVARIDGYDNIPSVTPTPTQGRGLTHAQRVGRLVANALVGRGATEVLTYPFVADSLADAFGLAAADERRFATRVANPLSDETPLMRTSVLASLVEALRRNVSRGQKDVALFEVGSVTLPGPGSSHTAPVPGVERRPDPETIAAIEAALPRQPRHVAVVAVGEVERAGWWGAGRGVDWSDLVDAARAVAAALALELTVEADPDHAPWHPGRCARISLPDGTLVGHAGELHPKVLAALGLPPRTCAAELDVEVLTVASAPATRFAAFSSYPLAFTDVALVVGEAVTAAEVDAALRVGAGEWLESVTLFDLYAGDQVGAGRKSLAYRLAFRADGRTLTTEEVNGFRDAAVAAASAAVGAVQR